MLTAEMSIEQVKDGHKYEGLVGMGGVLFRYTIEFMIPMNMWDEPTVSAPLTHEEVRNIFRVHLYGKEDGPIELDKVEYAFFLDLITKAAVDLYNQPLTRFINAVTSRLTADELLLVGNEIIGSNLTMGFDLTEKGIEMLAQPKFGCQFASA